MLSRHVIQPSATQYSYLHKLLLWKLIKIENRHIDFFSRNFLVRSNYLKLLNHPQNIRVNEPKFQEMRKMQQKIPLIKRLMAFFPQWLIPPFFYRSSSRWSKGISGADSANRADYEDSRWLVQDSYHCRSHMWLNRPSHSRESRDKTPSASANTSRQIGTSQDTRQRTTPSGIAQSASGLI